MTMPEIIVFALGIAISIYCARYLIYPRSKLLGGFMVVIVGAGSTLIGPTITSYAYLMTMGSIMLIASGMIIVVWEAVNP